MKEIGKMPAESVYWSSADSRKSISGSFRSGGRQYVDPWDLENYAYLRHSVIDISCRTRHRFSQERSLRDARARSEYWYGLSSMRKPKYDDSLYTRELYCGLVRSNNSYYQQTIYEKEGMEYAALFPVYTPILEISRFPPQEGRSFLHVDEDKYIVKAISSHGHLNTYGHLKIDYTNNWNSLNRRIIK